MSLATTPKSPATSAIKVVISNAHDPQEQSHGPLVEFVPSRRSSLTDLLIQAQQQPFHSRQGRSCLLHPRFDHCNRSSTAGISSLLTIPSS